MIDLCVLLYRFRLSENILPSFINFRLILMRRILLGLGFYTIYIKVADLFWQIFFWLHKLYYYIIYTFLWLKEILFRNWWWCNYFWMFFFLFIVFFDKRFSMWFWNEKHIWYNAYWCFMLIIDKQYMYLCIYNWIPNLLLKTLWARWIEIKTAYSILFN